MKKISLIFLIILMINCGKPLITNTHSGKYTAGIYNNKNYMKPAETMENPKVSPIVNNVKITPLETPPEEKQEKERSIVDYDIQVQQKLVEIGKGYSKNSEDFIKFMNAKFSEVSKHEKLQTDYSKITLRFTFSYINEFLRNDSLYGTNTRLEYLNTTLTTDSDNFIFYAVDKFKNINDQVDLGTLGRTQNVTFGAELNANYGVTNTANNKDSNTNSKVVNNNIYDSLGNVIGTTDNTLNDNNSSDNTTTAGAGATGKVNYDNSTTYNEQVTHILKKLTSGYSISDHSLTVMRRSFPLSEMPNETFLTTTLKFTNKNGKNFVFPAKVYVAEKLWQSPGVAEVADRVEFNSRVINYNKCDAALSSITLKVSYDGLLRIAKNTKNNNQGEFDDTVNFQKFENIITKDIVVDPNEFCRNVYGIIVENENKVYTLYFKTLNMEIAEKMLFFQEDNYGEFISWLSEVTKTTDPLKLKTKRYQFIFRCFDKTGINCDNIEVVSDDMNAVKLKTLKDFLKNKAILPFVQE